MSRLTKRSGAGWVALAAAAAQALQQPTAPPAGPKPKQEYHLEERTTPAGVLRIVIYAGAYGQVPTEVMDIVEHAVPAKCRRIAKRKLLALQKGEQS